MRKQVLINILRAAVVAVPVLAGCGGPSGGGGVVLPPGGLTFPDCTDGQLIAVGADRTLSCTSAPVGKLNPTACQAGTQAMTAKAGGVLDCVNKGMGGNDQTLRTRIDTATMKVNNLKTNVDVLSAGGGGKAVYVGTTAAGTKGRITDGAGLFGIGAASKKCEAEFGAGAHMCTVFELFDSVSTNVIKQATVVPASWVYMEGWNTPVANPSNPGEGLNENCASYNYDTADQKWQGMQFTWATTALNNVDKALHFKNVACNATLPISCCK